MRIRVPSPTMKDRCLEKLFHPSSMLLHRPHPWDLLHTLEHHPPWPSPYFVEITRRQRWVSSQPYLHNHFPNKTWLKDTTLLIPKPPISTGKHTFSQATKGYLKLPSKDHQRKFLWILSNLAATINWLIQRNYKNYRFSLEYKISHN